MTTRSPDEALAAAEGGFFQYGSDSAYDSKDSRFCFVSCGVVEGLNIEEDGCGGGLEVAVVLEGAADSSVRGVEDVKIAWEVFEAAGPLLLVAEVKYDAKSPPNDLMLGSVRDGLKGTLYSLSLVTPSTVSDTPSSKYPHTHVS